MTADLSPRTNPVERVLALGCYGLLIAAPFTLGLLAFLAVLIAYWRRGAADAFVRSHYQRQIRSFWIDLIVVALGVACAVGALATGVGAVLFGLSEPTTTTPGTLPATLGAVALALVCGALLLRGVGGLVVGSALGAIRLASGRPARKTRRR